jgi:outer membrane lipoprotein-sorting protein
MLTTSTTLVSAARALALVLLIAGASAPLTAQASESADEIVLKADRIRFPSDGFQVDVTVTTTRPGQDPELREYRILAKGQQNSLVMTTAPAVDRGQVLLMKGDDLWAYLPKVSQPVRLPLSQRLTGQVSNGDLARANFAGDYDAKLVRTDTIAGEEHYVLELTAARRGVTYNKVLYWVSRKDYRPHKAEFYTLSNRLLKTCRYEQYRPLGGMPRPTRLVMEDSLKSKEKSVMDYSNMVARDLPDKVFTKQYLDKLQ